MADQAMSIKSSSNIKAVSYDDETSVLTVAFSSGATYVYTDVPPQVANGFSDAASPGQYLHSVIKPMYKAAKL
jgi:KTSC domain